MPIIIAREVKLMLQWIECKRLLIDAWCILKNVSVIPSFNTRNDHRMLPARIDIIPATEKR